MKSRKMAMALVACFAFTVILSGCNPLKDKTGDGNKSGVKTLRWVTIGPGKQVDSQMVWDEFNKKLAEKIPGVNINFEIIPPSDFSEKYKLLSASNEPLDLIWTGYVLNFAQEVRNGSYIALDELLDKYGTQVKQELPTWIWDKVKIDNKIYAVPIYQMMAAKKGMRVHSDMAKKYNLDEEKFSQLFQNNKYMTQECYDAISDYLAKLKAGGDIQKGVGNLYALPQKGFEDIVGGTYIKDRKSVV